MVIREPSPAQPRPADQRYTVVDELLVRPPLVVDPTEPAAQAARRMGEAGVDYAAVRVGEGWGVLTDVVLRTELVVAGRPGSTPVGELVRERAPTSVLGESADEALITLLDTEAPHLLVTDRAGAVRGAVVARDFVVSPATGGLSLHEQLRRAGDAGELARRAEAIPALLGGLLARGSTAGRVVAVYSAMIDTVVRRAIGFTFAAHPELSPDAFTWLSLGSNGRREAVLSSDVDSAVAFDDTLEPAEQERYRAAFADVHETLAACGLPTDRHGASAERAAFSRTNAQWRAAGEEWLADPENGQGAVMASLLVDGRPIHGDPGLPAVTEVFADLREHAGTMRLLLHESLSHRSRTRALRDKLGRRVETFDVKAHAVLPVVNIARWAALAARDAELRTPARLRAAAGSTMLPDEQAQVLVEVHEVLQRLRLRAQLADRRAGRPATDELRLAALSPIDRSTLAQAVREIATVQRRMDNVAAYTPAELWTSPAGG